MCEKCMIARKGLVLVWSSRQLDEQELHKKPRQIDVLGMTMMIITLPKVLFDERSLESMKSLLKILLTFIDLMQPYLSLPNRKKRIGGHRFVRLPKVPHHS